MVLENVRLNGRPATFGGVRMQLSREEEPLFGVPSLTMEAGLGCAIRKGAEMEPGACRSLEDLRTWSQLTWRP